MENPLQFLGLYKTHNDASGRQLIPARVISGDTDESQILVAGQRYLDRPTVLESILNDLFHVLRYLVTTELYLRDPSLTFPLPDMKIVKI